MTVVSKDPLSSTGNGDGISISYEWFAGLFKSALNVVTNSNSSSSSDRYIVSICHFLCNFYLGFFTVFHRFYPIYLQAF